MAKKTRAKAKEESVVHPEAVAPPAPPVPPPPPGPEVNAKCRRGNEPVTAGSSCNNLRAYKLSPDGATHVTLRCTRCNFTWTTAVGGTFQGM